MDRTRSLGILMPIFSLPSEECVGTLGEGAFEFVDFLIQSGAGVWQILPIGPTLYGNSPYQPCSAKALNYYFIDLYSLVKDGLLTKNECAALTPSDERRVDYGLLFHKKIALLRLAFSRFNKEDKGFIDFVKEGTYSDFAVYSALKTKFSHRAFYDWDPPYNAYNEELVRRYAEENKNEVLFWQFTQYIFLAQWNRLKKYANSRGVKIMGDMPLYLAPDSVEMWKEGDKLFQVDKMRRPSFVAASPPDAFSSFGQRWGNPLYDWKKMEGDGYKWWKDRISYNLSLFDIVRVDHFRAFDRYYAVPAEDSDARGGTWMDGPKEKLFEDMLDENIVAEDLCLSDEGVVRLMKNVGYPGMKISQHAFDGNADNEHKPFNFGVNTVCYTGTHDNDPLMERVGGLDDREKTVFLKDLISVGRGLGVRVSRVGEKSICSSIVLITLASKAFLAVIPMWDVLSMGEEARMNFPSEVSDKNWTFRFTYHDYGAGEAHRLKRLAVRYGRFGQK